MTLMPRDPGFWGIENCDPDGRDYRRAPAYRDMKERLTDVMLDRVERAFPGARAQVQWSEAATPATQTRYARTTGGAPFGLAVSPTQYGPTRPGSDVTASESGRALQCPPTLIGVAPPWTRTPESHCPRTVSAPYAHG
jgi:hypothetical protein